MKHIFLLIAVLSLGYIGVSQSQIIPEDEKPPVDVAQIIADDLVNGVNPELDRRIEHFRNRWETLWENKRKTPAEIVEKMGTRAGRFFLASSIERAYFQSIANATGLTLSQLLGDDKYTTPKYQVTVNEDGTATIEDEEE